MTQTLRPGGLTEALILSLAALEVLKLPMD